MASRCMIRASDGLQGMSVATLCLRLPSVMWPVVAAFEFLELLGGLVVGWFERLRAKWLVVV